MKTRTRWGLHGTIALTALGCLAIVAGGWRSAGAAGAAEEVAAEAADDDSRRHLARARASVESVDLDGGRVVLSMPGETVDLRVDERTTVFINGRPGGLDEIEEGDSVCAAWTPERAPVAEWLEPCSK